jgi:hypothetical protein
VELPSQLLDQLFLNGVSIWNISDPDSPSDIPTEGNWNNADRTISGGAENFKMQFGIDLEPGVYNVHIGFDSGCRVTGSITIP